MLRDHQAVQRTAWQSRGQQGIIDEADVLRIARIRQAADESGRRGEFVAAAQVELMHAVVGRGSEDIERKVAGNGTGRRRAPRIDVRIRPG